MLALLFCGSLIRGNGLYSSCNTADGSDCHNRTADLVTMCGAMLMLCRPFASFSLSSLLAYALSICSTRYTFPAMGDDPTTSDYGSYVN
jgi:hypothetical protein